MKNRYFTYLAICILVMMTLACNFSISELLESEPISVDFTETPSLSFLPVTISPTPELEITPTETLSAVDEPEDPICVTWGEASQVPELTRYENLFNELQLALNNGISEYDLENALIDSGFGLQPDPVTLGDLTGDGKYELMVSVINPQSQLVNPGGTYMIFNCANGVYRLAHLLESETEDSVSVTRMVLDLNSDGVQEAIVASQICGAHTCFERYQLLMWNGQSYENRLMGMTNDLPYPEIQVTDYDDDGYYDIEITGTGYGSVGAGPQRGLTRRWANNPATNQWDIVGEIQGGSNYRIHVLHDADANYRSKNYDIARALYTDAILNDNLDDWMEPEKERKLITAYAEYKIFTIYLIQDDTTRAEQYLQEMKNKYGDQQSGTFVEAMDVLYTNFLTEGLNAACGITRTYVESYQDELLKSLGPSQFGYANPEITLSDLCP